MSSRASMIAALSLAGLLAACAGPDDSSGGGKADGFGDPATCASFHAPVKTGRLRRGGAREVSGLVASRANPGVFWAHNDGPGDGELFAFDRQGRLLAVVTLGVDVIDAEDLSFGPGPDGEAYLYLADTGDNEVDRKTVRIFRFPEPTIGLDQERGDLVAAAVETATYRYDDGDAHDAEALVVDPATGELVVLTKAVDDRDETLVFAGPPAFGGDGELARITSSDELPGLAGSVVAADVTQDGRAIVVGFKSGAFRYFEHASRGDHLWEILATPACTVAETHGQHEAVGFAADGQGFYLVPEGEDPAILFVARAAPCPSFAKPVTAAHVATGATRDLSGLAASRLHPGIAWAIDDAGVGVAPRLVAIELATGAVRATVAVDGIDPDSDEWEDLAVGPGPGGAALFIGDSGDPDLDGDRAQIYRLPEPALGATTAAAERFDLGFDDGDSHDVKSVLVDPVRGDLVLVTRRRSGDGTTRVFAAPGFALAPDDVVLTEVLDEHDADALDATFVTGEVSGDGGVVALGVRDDAPRFWPRHPDAPIWEGLQARACPGREVAGATDAVALEPTGFGHWLIPSGAAAPVLRVTPR